MQSSRIENAIVFLAMSVAITTAIFQNLFDSINLYFFSYIAIELMWAYSIYWAFSVRRLLSVGTYRNQALGVGMVALAWLIFLLFFYSSNNLLAKSILSLAILVTFYWIDSSVLAGRKSDPLYRNTFHWREVRLLAWPVLVASVIILFPSWQLIGTGHAVLGNSPSLLSVVSFYIGGYVLLSTGSVYLIAVAARSKDRILRRHLFWFGIFIVSYTGFIQIWGITGINFFDIAAYLIGSYCLYRSAKSLAPINEILDHGAVKIKKQVVRSKDVS